MNGSNMRKVQTSSTSTQQNYFPPNKIKISDLPPAKTFLKFLTPKLQLEGCECHELHATTKYIQCNR